MVRGTKTASLFFAPDFSKPCCLQFPFCFLLTVMTRCRAFVLFCDIFALSYPTKFSFRLRPPVLFHLRAIFFSNSKSTSAQKYKCHVDRTNKHEFLDRFVFCWPRPLLLARGSVYVDFESPLCTPVLPPQELPHIFLFFSSLPVHKSLRLFCAVESSHC